MERLTLEVATLSTRLVEEVAKSLELESQVYSFHRDMVTLRQQAEDYPELSHKYTLLKSEVTQLRLERDAAEAENERLNHEVEELTASLFDEANNMVNNASQETLNYKIKNQKLKEELQEKSTIILDLQEQLTIVKEMLMQRDEEDRRRPVSHSPAQKPNRQFATGELLLEAAVVTVADSDSAAAAATTTTSTTSTTNQVSATDSPGQEKSNSNIDFEDDEFSDVHQVLYSPTINQVRFDLDNFLIDFSQFVYTITRPTFTYDLANLRLLKWFKKVWTEEIENSFVNVPAIPTLKIMIRLQPERTFWNCVVEGKVIVEPVNSVNETFKLSYQSHGASNGHGGNNATPPPVATKEPCSFCGESRDDILEHCRLYCMKVEQDDVVSQTVYYPLCNYCLIKLRNVCDFFAKVRMIRSNVFKLNIEYADTADILASRTVNPDASALTRFMHLSTIQSHIKVKSLKDKSIVVRYFVMLALVRVKIFWSKIGIWDLNVPEVSLDELHRELFMYLVDPQFRETLAKEIRAAREAAAAARIKAPATPKNNSARSSEEAPVRSESNGGDQSNEKRTVSHKRKESLQKLQNELDATAAMLQDLDLESPITEESKHRSLKAGEHHEESDSDDEQEFKDTSDTVIEPK